jgi:hypothetical protein
MTVDGHSSMNKVELNSSNRRPLEWMGLTSTIPRHRLRSAAAQREWTANNPRHLQEPDFGGWRDVLADDRLPISIADVL